MTLDPKARDGLVAALLREETWPSFSSLNPGLKDHMYALGVLITRYNDLEFTLYSSHKIRRTVRSASDPLRFWQLTYLFRVSRAWHACAFGHLE
jgi:hypothetical protein